MSDDEISSEALGLRVRRDLAGSNAEVGRAVTVEFRPTLRVWEFLTDLFTLPTDKRGNPRIGDVARLASAYPDEFLYFPYVPVSVQRALAVPLSKLGLASR